MRNDLQTQRICRHIAMVEQAVAWQKAHGIDRTCEHYGVVIFDDKNNSSGYKDTESLEWIKKRTDQLVDLAKNDVEARCLKMSSSAIFTEQRTGCVVGEYIRGTSFMNTFVVHNTNTKGELRLLPVRSISRPSPLYMKKMTETLKIITSKP